MKRKTIKLVAISIVLALLVSISSTIVLAAGDLGGERSPAEPDPNESVTVEAQKPTITTQPANTNVTVNGNITLSVAATVGDGGILTYQWYLSTSDSNTNGALINGATSETFIPATKLEGTLFYFVVVTNTVTNETVSTSASTISNTARVTVSAPLLTNAQSPSITSSPRDSMVLINDRLTLSVTAQVTDGGSLSYQWFSNTADRNTGGTAISGATGRAFTPSTNREGTVFYYVVVTNTNNNVNGAKTATTTSGTAKVTVNIAINAQTPNITRQPEGGTVTLDDRFTLTVTAEIRDNGALSYQWFSSETDSNTSGTAIQGATRATFIPDTSTLGITYYYVEVTNTNNDATGVKITMTSSIAVPVIISTTPEAPQNLTATPGADYVTLNWAAPENDGYSEIIRYQVSSDLVNFWFTADEEYEHTFTDLVSETEYTFSVRAVNQAGFGEEAVIIVMTTEPEPVDVTGVTLDEEELNIYVGKSAQLNATVMPKDADDQSVTWQSGNTDVATVDEYGVVTGHAKGIAIITVTTNEGGYTARSIITVAYPDIASDHLLLWIGLGTLAPLGTGAGVYLWRRKRR